MALVDADNKFIWVYLGRPWGNGSASDAGIFNNSEIKEVIENGTRYLGRPWGNGSASDAGIFNNSEIKEVIENDTTCFPAADPLPNDDRQCTILLSEMMLFL